MGQNPDRFMLTFTNSALLSNDITNTIDDGLIISNLNDMLKFKSNRVISSLLVYDILGRELVDSNPDSKLFELKLANVKPGTIVVIKATLDNERIINKKTIIF